MQLRTALLLASASLLSVAVAVGCSSDDTTNTGSEAATSGDASPDTSSTAASTGTGMGGGTTSGGGMGGTGTANGGAGGTGGTGTGGGAIGDHLLISELAVQPTPAEFIEIYNPTAATVDLGDYYLSDNSTYVGIATGQPWMPITMNAGSDFLVQFPAGSSIAAGAVIVVATSTEYEATYMKCPDYVFAAADVPCTNGTAKAMKVPTNGGVEPGTTTLSNDREMVVLFTWDGNTANLLQDVDYLTWGDMFEAGTRVDKTAEAGYKADTAPDMQKGAPAPASNGTSIERCGPNLENGEKTSGGNGITGHDETSEDLGASFKIQAMPSPGVKNACL